MLCRSVHLQTTKTEITHTLRGVGDDGDGGDGDEEDDDANTGNDNDDLM